MTGRGLGRCGAGLGAGGAQGMGFGRGGRGRCFAGRGQGWGRGIAGGYAQGPPADANQVLQAQLAEAREELAALKSRLDALEK